MSKYPPELITKLRQALTTAHETHGIVTTVLDALTIDDIQYLATQHGFHLVSRDELLRPSDSLECPCCGYEGMIFGLAEKVAKVDEMLRECGPKSPFQTTLIDSSRSLYRRPPVFKPLASEDVLSEVPQIDLDLPKGAIPLSRYVSDYRVLNFVKILMELLRYLAQGMSPTNAIVQEAFIQWTNTFGEVYDIIEEFPKREGAYTRSVHGQRIIDSYIAVWATIPQEALDDETKTILGVFKALLVENEFKLNEM